MFSGGWALGSEIASSAWIRSTWTADIERLNKRESERGADNTQQRRLDSKDAKHFTRKEREARGDKPRKYDKSSRRLVMLLQLRIWIRDT